MPKRRRTIYGPKRDVLKSITTVENTVSGTTQQESLLYENTVKQTVVVSGLRWSLNFSSGTTPTNPFNYRWAIVLVPDTYNANDLAIAGDMELYEPQQHCIIFGSGVVAPFAASAGDCTKVHEGFSKTSRKMREGDKLVLLVRGSGDSGDIIYDGCISYYVKN